MGWFSDIFDDVLGFDPNGGGIYDTFLGDILGNPVVNTLLKLTPMAPAAWAWDTGSAFGQGKYGKGLLSALGGYNSLGGFEQATAPITEATPSNYLTSGDAISGGASTPQMAGMTISDTLSTPAQMAGYATESAGIPLKMSYELGGAPGGAIMPQAGDAIYNTGTAVNPTGSLGAGIIPSPQMSATLGGRDIGFGLSPYMPGSMPTPSPAGQPGQSAGPDYQKRMAGQTGYPDWYAGAMGMPGGLTYENIMQPSNSGFFGGLTSDKVIGGLLKGMLQSNMLSELQEANDPFGKQRKAYLAQLQQLEADPSRIYNSPEYQAAFNQGLKALSRSYASRRMGDSGNALLARQKYGQQLASSALTNEKNRLATLAGAGIGPNTSAQRDQYDLYTNIMNDLLKGMDKQKRTGIMY